MARIATVSSSNGAPWASSGTYVQYIKYDTVCIHRYALCRMIGSPVLQYTVPSSQRLDVHGVGDVPCSRSFFHPPSSILLCIHKTQVLLPRHIVRHAGHYPPNPFTSLLSNYLPKLSHTCHLHKFMSAAVVYLVVYTTSTGSSHGDDILSPATHNTLITP